MPRQRDTAESNAPQGVGARRHFSPIVRLAIPQTLQPFAPKDASKDVPAEIDRPLHNKMLIATGLAHMRHLIHKQADAARVSAGVETKDALRSPIGVGASTARLQATSAMSPVGAGSSFVFTQKSATRAVVSESSDAKYTLPTSADTLYAIEKPAAEKLPLELFDSGEYELLTPQQWVDLGSTRYNGAGTPARSLFFANKEWMWAPCLVHSYDESREAFLVQFNDRHQTQKWVKRLSLCFDDEPEDRFQIRLQLAKERREETLAQRRLQQFVSLQRDEVVAPIQQGTVVRIVNRLMSSVSHLSATPIAPASSDVNHPTDVLGAADDRAAAIPHSKSQDSGVVLAPHQQQQIEQLLVDARDEYCMAMKHSVVNHKRLHDPVEAEKMVALQLPPVDAPPAVPYSALVDIPERSLPFQHALTAVHLSHFSSLPNAVQVMLSLMRAADRVTDCPLIDMNTSGSAGSLRLPMTLYEFQDHQEEFFGYQKDLLLTEWRSHVINKIRDNLSGTFNLFINDADKYFGSSLHRFLTMVSCLMRTQLSNLLVKSIASFETFVRKYDSNAAEADAAAVADRPLFVFKLSAQDGKIAFLPPLESMTQALIKVLDVTSKTANIHEVDSEVCPLLGLLDTPMVTANNSPHLHEAQFKAAQSIQQVVDQNLNGPIQLAASYEALAESLAADPKEYAVQWFAFGLSDGASGLSENEDKEQDAGAANTDDHNAENDDQNGGADNKPKPHSLQETRTEIQRFWDMSAQIADQNADDVAFPMVLVQCHLAKEQLVARAKQASQRLLEQLAEQVRSQANQIDEQCQDILARIKTKPQDAYQLANLIKLTQTVESTDVPKIRDAISEMQAKMRVLEEFMFSLPHEAFTLCWSIVRLPQIVLDTLQETKVQIAQDTVRFQSQLDGERETFHKDLVRYRAQVDRFAHCGSGCTLAEMEEYATQVEALREKLNRCRQQVTTFSERDELFGVQPKEYTELQELQAQFELYFNLWSTTSDFHASHALWMTGPFIELDAQKVVDNVDNWYKLMFKLEKALADQAPEPAKVAEEMRKKIEEFRHHVPIIQWLRAPGLRPRHWTRIAQLLGAANLVPDHSLTFTAVLNLPVHKFAEQIEEVCNGADKEYGLELALDKMVNEWKPMQLQLDEYKETKTYILKNSDDIITLLDDHIMKTQAMRGSPYIKPFEMRCKQWEARLQLVSQIMEQWLACQQTWLYLEPIFSSEDIMRQMPNEGRRFQMVDAYWHKTMDAARRTGNVLDFAGETEALLKGFEDCNKMLEMIGKGLNDYLETKRLAFPRFYFLSNDELLNILSQTKNATAVQPHLSKCFDAVVALDFTETQVITAMCSGEGERVPFAEQVDPNLGSRKGNVEVWLKEVERVMRTSLEKEMRDALMSYNSTPREQWVLGPPGQVVLAASQAMWTAEVEQAMRKNGKKGLTDYVKKLNAQLQKLVELVRGDLSSLNRLTLGALTVVDVHARDVVMKLCEQGVGDANQFEWLSQMRYYWETETGANAAPGAGRMKVRMVNTSMDYGYEYLGNTTRLVITPLTDRAYATLMGAVHLHLGGAPEGPAGTGKTETVKDLSKAIAIQCVVFNCSDGLDYLAMAKFFKGLASSGAWSCFDEFNRIELEVLSVIAQQISSIQRAVVEGKVQFFFDNVTIPLVHTCTVFITMNPGYAGRAELPDNLKALFRTVAMMVPDYALIAEIVLYSYGYSEARALSRKIVSCLRLSSEQLSSQEHYDFGMRNLKSILTAAGALRRSDPSSKEGILCLRAIVDCNLPKFVSNDIPLFMGITKDLFPDVELPSRNYELLHKAAVDACVKMNLRPTAEFLAKVMELYETIMVRHGVMVVGQAWSGKSSCLRVLAAAITALGAAKQPGFSKVKTYPLNPKSIPPGQLYGEFDKNTHEWTDGILPVAVRDAVQDQSDTRKWIIFDGPVDAMWIENMNTVLDDNKKLCLASGEIIRISNTTTFMFEVEDLALASPATVSRCGMVFMEPRQLGWKPIVDSWLAALPETMATHIAYLQSLFETVVHPCLEYVTKNCKPVIPTDDIGQVSNLTRMLGTLLDEFRVPASTKPAVTDGSDGASTAVTVPAAVEQQQAWLDSLFAFATVWSIGAGTDAAGRAHFSEFFQQLTGSTGARPLRVPFPTGAEAVSAGVGANATDVVPANAAVGASVYDFVFNKATSTWQHWMSTIPLYRVPDNAEFHEIIVPTIDTVRTSWLLETLLTHQRHTLLVGETGTGKTIAVHKKIVHELDRSVYVPLLMTFSARTSANQTQELLDSKLERRRHGVAGPPLYKKCVVFVDDLNMPMREMHNSQAIGAQPPIELLRQWMDYGGWYDRGLNTFKKVVDIQFVAAMGPPGGGRNHITKRYLRHFNSVCLTPYDDASLKRIFSTITDWWLGKFPAASAVNAAAISQSLVSATVDMYSTIQKELLPTPAKSHYTFNLRDISKVFQGMLGAWTGGIKNDVDMMRLWLHESTRVFSDRLVNQQDVKWFDNLMNTKIQQHFGTGMDQVLDANSRALIYADFGDSSRSGAAAAQRRYTEVKDYVGLKKSVESVLSDYNQMNSKAPMNLVFFTAAIEHVARISRIVRQPYGNALLVGVGGSGRQSLTRLAAFIADYEVFQVEVSKAYNVPEWREDLRTIMRKAGLAGKPIVFLFTDSQIKHESFMEDINNILNTGEVPHLFPSDDLMAIIEELMPAARKAGQGESNASIYSFFVNRCRQNIHVVLCMSPIGAAFRNRLRTFPSLVNCTTIDWFHPWPTEALRSVAQRFLAEVQLPDNVKTGVVDVCVDMQERVIALSEEFHQALGRFNYVTPTSYLELIRTFTDLYDTKRQEIGAQKAKYENGLRKLEDTAEQVKTMQAQLEVLQPQLIKSSQETELLMKTIETRSAEVARTRTVVEIEEKECNAQAAAASKIRDECNAQLAEAMPALQGAIDALNVVNKNDLTEMKSMKVPPAGVVLTIQALCYMMEVPPVKVGDVGKKKDDYFEAAKKTFLRDTNFLETLKTFDKDNIPVEVMNNIRPLTKNPEFVPPKIAKASKAAESFCKWVRAMEVYDRVAKEVKPKKEALKVAQDTLANAESQLASKKAQLQEVQDLLDDLNHQFEQVNQKKKLLQSQVEECSKRLERAEKLIGGLGGEKSRWSASANRLAEDYANVVGNILVASGVIAYLGVFTGSYRQRCIAQWLTMLKQKGIPCDTNFTLHRSLGDPVQIREWTMKALPKDDFSIDNAIILHKAKRWGLMIDPQGQANRWIKMMEEPNQLKVIKQSDAGQFVRHVQNAVQFGLPLLIENVDERLDPVLEPLLLRQFYKQGGRLMIQLGGEALEYNTSFRLYITTKLTNPHYPPEISTKVTLINFMITPQGLEDQMLGIVVSKEEPELERERSELIVKNAENQKQLQATEDRILQLLNDSKGMILDDEELIQTLQKSKVESIGIEKRLAAAVKTEERINKTRAEYQSVASSAANLFFCITDLAIVDPMYQYSLSWFIGLFVRAIEDAPAAKHVAQRTQNIDHTVMYALYRNVCRSLFEKDKLLFSFLLCLRVLQAKHQVDARELRFLLTGMTVSVGAENVVALPNPVGVGGWLADSAWTQCLALARLEKFASFPQIMTTYINDYKRYYLSSDPFASAVPGPADFSEKLTPLQKMLILRCLRPDKLSSAIQTFVSTHLGQKYIEPPGFDLAGAFTDSDQCTPLVFILSPGVDPSKEIFKFAESRGFGNLENISLGQGQGPIAEQALRDAMDKGSWVMLQNCHLALSWLPTLERIVEELTPENTNPNFRLWLTSMPTTGFPISILQNGVKMTNEPPKGIKASLMNSFRAVDDKLFASSTKPEVLKKLYYGLAFFHALVLERRKFGPLGWNIRYEFTEGDFSISLKQLQMFIDSYPQVPFKALKYLIGQLNYGGRVTDDWDRRTLACILEDFMSEAVLSNTHNALHAFDAAGAYTVPAEGTSAAAYREHIMALPQNDTPDVFGLHDNAALSSAVKESTILLNSVLAMQPKTTSGSGLSRFDVVSAIARDIESKLPANFDITAAGKKFPTVYNNSMNTVLVQELVRFNRLLDKVRSSLSSLQKAIKGEQIMSLDLEKMADALFDGQVPDMWAAVAYPSLKPLGAWVIDLLARLSMFSDWLRKGPPGAFWISGFFFTQSFLTGILQNYARSHHLPIDDITFDFQVMDDIEIKDGGLDVDITPPADGCYVYGLFLEGARWDSKSKCIGKSLPKQPYAKMPVIWLKPVSIKALPQDRSTYACPVYKTSKRAGVLSTTGHSTNYVLTIQLPSDFPESYWVKKGVALLTQLDN